MASALLAGRSEVHHWGEARVSLMPKPPNPNTRHPFPNPNPGVHPTPPTQPEASSPRYVTYRPAALARREALELRERLAGELGQVRALLSRIDTWQQRPHQASPRGHAPPPPSKLRAAMLKRCSQILTKLRKHKQSVWFNAPVDVEGLGLHDYHTIIKNPMDLGTVRDNLAAERYPSHDAFAADVRLTFSNALRYNPVGHQVHTFAGNLLASFEVMYKAAVSWLDQECHRLDPPTPMPVAQPPSSMSVQPTMPVQVPPRMGNVKRPKPKAREPNKREMSMEEKHKLRMGLESLPEEKMQNVLQIVRKRNGDPELLGDEIELDIDELDVETLWELDRFVGNFKKALSKSRRAASRNGNTGGVTVAVAAEDNAVPVNVNVNAPMLVDIGDSESETPEKRTRVAEPVDEYVDIGDEIPTTNYQSVEIEKDAGVASSMGGSSSGSSSSSGSESGSSGDSDSDAGDAQSPA